MSPHQYCPAGKPEHVVVCSTFVPLEVKLAFTFSIKFLVPSIVFVTDIVCVTNPFVCCCCCPPAAVTVTGTVVDVGGFISIVTYFGTATCKCNPYNGASVVLMNFASRTEFCLFHASGFVHTNSTVSPSWVKPGTVTPTTSVVVETEEEPTDDPPEDIIVDEVVLDCSGTVPEMEDAMLVCNDAGAANDIILPGVAVAPKTSNPPLAALLMDGVGLKGLDTGGWGVAPKMSKLVPNAGTGGVIDAPTDGEENMSNPPPTLGGAGGAEAVTGGIEKISDSRSASLGVEA